MVLAYRDPAVRPVPTELPETISWRGLTIHRATGVDLPALCDILRAAHSEQRYCPEDLRRYADVDGAGLWLAQVQGRPVGVAGFVRYGALARIGAVGVHPSAQGTGVARTLMTHILRSAAMGCVSVVLDATPAAIRLYTGLGFVSAGSTALFVRSVPPSRTPGGTAVVRSPRALAVTAMEPQDLRDVVVFDAPLFGAARPSALSLFASDHRRTSLVARDSSGRLAGYLIARRSGIGPFVARTPRAASALLEAAESWPLDAPASVVLPVENMAGVALLTRHGFRCERVNTFMRRGDPVCGQRAALFGQASFALG